MDEPKRRKQEMLTWPTFKLINTIETQRTELSRLYLLNECSIEQMNDNQSTIDKLNEFIQKHCAAPSKEAPVSKNPCVYEGQTVGSYYVEIDGFWRFEPLPGLSTGYWSEGLLRFILVSLRVLNAKADVDMQTDPVLQDAD